MKDLSLFLLKNYLGSKMRKSFCNDDGSTSTLNQHHQNAAAAYSPYRQEPTLEEMILQLELEETTSKVRHRMSCVNSSDILRSARSALNQYPRFSLDGRDAMYRSSFEPRKMRFEPSKMRGLPAVVAGERVVWCSPGVVAKLMGLEAMPVPIKRHRRVGSREPERGSCSRQQGYCMMKPLTADVERRFHHDAPAARYKYHL